MRSLSVSSSRAGRRARIDGHADEVDEVSRRWAASAAPWPRRVGRSARCSSRGRGSISSDRGASRLSFEILPEVNVRLEAAGSRVAPSTRRSSTLRDRAVISGLGVRSYARGPPDESQYRQPVLRGRFSDFAASSTAKRSPSARFVSSFRSAEQMVPTTRGKSAALKNMLPWPGLPSDGDNGLSAKIAEEASSKASGAVGLGLDLGPRSASATTRRAGTQVMKWSSSWRTPHRSPSSSTATPAAAQLGAPPRHEARAAQRRRGLHRRQTLPESNNFIRGTAQPPPTCTSSPARSARDEEAQRDEDFCRRRASKRSSRVTAWRRRSKRGEEVSQRPARTPGSSSTRRRRTARSSSSKEWAIASR